MCEVDADDVAATRGQDRVHADPGDVGGADRPPPHGPVRVGGGEDVPPRAARAHELHELAADPDEERHDLDLGEEAPEMLGGVPDRLDHGLTVAASWLFQLRAVWSDGHTIGTLQP